MTRSKELQRIHEAIAHRNEAELKWALDECELRKRYRTRTSDRWYQIEKQIRSLLAELAGESK